MISIGTSPMPPRTQTDSSKGPWWASITHGREGSTLSFRLLGGLADSWRFFSTQATANYRPGRGRHTDACFQWLKRCSHNFTVSERRVEAFTRTLNIDSIVNFRIIVFMGCFSIGQISMTVRWASLSGKRISHSLIELN